MSESEHPRLVDPATQYERLRVVSKVDYTAAEQAADYLPPHLTVPVATWELAQRVRVLLEERAAHGAMRRKIMRGTEDKAEVTDLLGECFKSLITPHGRPVTDDDWVEQEQRSAMFLLLLHEVLSNALRRRDPNTGLWTGLDEYGFERDDLKNIPHDQLYQQGTVHYGLEMQQHDAGVQPFLFLHLADEAKGWPDGRKGFNPYQVPNPLKDSSNGQDAAGVLAVCRRGLLLSRRYIGEHLQGAGFYLPVEPDMSLEKLRAHEFFFRLPVAQAPMEVLQERFDDVHSRMEADSRERQRTIDAIEAGENIQLTIAGAN